MWILNVNQWVSFWTFSVFLCEPREKAESGRVVVGRTHFLSQVHKWVTAVSLLPGSLKGEAARRTQLTPCCPFSLLLVPVTKPQLKELCCVQWSQVLKSRYVVLCSVVVTFSVVLEFTSTYWFFPLSCSTLCRWCRFIIWWDSAVVSLFCSTPVGEPASAATEAKRFCSWDWS